MGGSWYNKMLNEVEEPGSGEVPENEHGQQEQQEQQEQQDKPEEPKKASSDEEEIHERSEENARIDEADFEEEMKKEGKKMPIGPDRIDVMRQIVKSHSMNYGIDVQTANAFITVYDALTEDKNKKSMEEMPIDKIINIVWKLVK